MDLENLRLYCLSKTGACESFPFDQDTLVFKVMSKIFAIIPLERDPLQINLKCDPEQAIELREQYPEDIYPAYHMNKKHWNSVYLDHNLKSQLIKTMVDGSYQLVLVKLTKKEKQTLESLEKNA